MKRFRGLCVCLLSAALLSTTLVTQFQSSAKGKDEPSGSLVRSATYRSEDDDNKVVDFYRQKFSGSKQVSVQAGISYFGVTNADGSGLTATISPAPDKLAQIILRHDKKQ